MGKSVGIMEDDKTIRDLLEQLTRGKGHMPVVLSSAEEALSQASAGKLSLLLIAHSAKGIHTPEFCREIHTTLPDCKIVILAASPLEWSEPELEERGVARVLEKPFSRKQVLSLFQEYLGPRESLSHQRPSVSNAPTRKRARPKRKKILIVDDDRSLVTTMREVLERHDFSVSTASDGVEALEAVQNKDFDIIITDIHMPRMGGVETIQKIKQLSPSSFILMMTGEGTDFEIKEGLTEGGYACIHKPFSIKKLLRSIEWYSQAAHQSRQSWERKKRLEQRSFMKRWRAGLKKKWRDWSRRRRAAIVSGALVLVTIFLSVFLTLFLQYMGTTLTEQASQYNNLTREMINTLKKSQMRNLGSAQMELPREQEDFPRERAPSPMETEE